MHKHCSGGGFVAKCKVWRLNCNCTPIKGVKTAKSSCFELQLLFHPICASLSDGLNYTSNCKTWINSRFITLSSLLGLGGRGFMSATNYHHIMSNKIPFIKLYCPIKHLRNNKPMCLVNCNGVVSKYDIFVHPMKNYPERKIFPFHQKSVIFLSF